MTRIQLHITRDEWEVLNRALNYAYAASAVIDIISLYENEVLEEVFKKFDSKKFKSQVKFIISLSLVECIVFSNAVSKMVQQMGNDYENAVYTLFYQREISIQLSRALQSKMKF